MRPFVLPLVTSDSCAVHSQAHLQLVLHQGLDIAAPQFQVLPALRGVTRCVCETLNRQFGNLMPSLQTGRVPFVCDYI